LAYGQNRSGFWNVFAGIKAAPDPENHSCFSKCAANIPRMGENNILKNAIYNITDFAGGRQAAREIVRLR
jgi:hypothetical protein